jgi:hypothetical protein
LPVLLARRKNALLLFSLLLVFLAQWKYSLLLPSHSLSLVRVSILACSCLSIFFTAGRTDSVGRVALCLSRSLAVLLAPRKIYLYLLRVCVHSSLSLSLFFLSLLGELLSVSLAPLIVLLSLRKLSLFLLLVCSMSLSLYGFCHCRGSCSLSLSLPCLFSLWFLSLPGELLSVSLAPLLFYSTIPCALLCLLIQQSTIRSTLHVDITTNYPLWSLW